MLLRLLPKHLSGVHGRVVSLGSVFHNAFRVLTSIFGPSLEGLFNLTIFPVVASVRVEVEYLGLLLVILDQLDLELAVGVQRLHVRDEAVSEQHVHSHVLLRQVVIHEHAILERVIFNHLVAGLHHPEAPVHLLLFLLDQFSLNLAMINFRKFFL